MSPETQTSAPTPEEQAIAGLDATMQRIFSEAALGEPRKGILGFNPDDTVDTMLIPGGKGLIARATSPDGTVAYQTALSLWHSTGDRGAATVNWTQGGSEVTDVNQSDLEGNSPAVPKDLDGIIKFHQTLEETFPSNEQPRHSGGKLRRFIGRRALKS